MRSLVHSGPHPDMVEPDGGRPADAPPNRHHVAVPRVRLLPDEHEIPVLVGAAGHVTALR
jgi:hypothetical protein